VRPGELSLIAGAALLWASAPSTATAALFQTAVLLVGLADLNPYKPKKKKETDDVRSDAA
jgi:hypothetical protein